MNRCIPLCAFLLALGASRTSAILDTNSNGLSDVWERTHNDGNLFLPKIYPPDDEDGDGWTNAEEAAAGTDPFDSNPPDGILRPETTRIPEHWEDTNSDGIDELIPEAMTLVWVGVPGKQYTLLSSTDLVEQSWLPFDAPFLGNGNEITYCVYFTDSEKAFWRVAVTDIDTDGDGLTNAEEHALGTNPDLPDSDLDGISDYNDTTPLDNNVDPNPDGAGLVDATGNPTSLMTDMMGRWDFEAIDTISNPPSGHTPFRFLDSTTGLRHATAFATLVHDEGMISKAAGTSILPGGGFVTIPPSMLNNKAVYSISFWAALDKDSIANSNGIAIGLFGHHSYIPFISGSTPNWGLLNIEANGLWIEKSGTREILRAGTYSYTNHNGSGVPITPSSVKLGVVLDRPLGTSDDGLWHHYVLVQSGSITTLYIDGINKGSDSHTISAIILNNYAGISLGRLYGPAPESRPVQPANQPAAKGRFDRLRAWPRVVTQDEVSSLHHEDADHDGLWDITESCSSLWRDKNSDSIRTSSEVSFFVNPFRADPPGMDHDKDKISSLDEQLLGTNIYDADSDDDGLFDGYDMLYGQGALIPDVDLTVDADGDGLTLAEEMSYGTNPNVADSDGDHVNDGIEVAQNGRPLDASDAGQAPDPGAVLALRLGIGDESGSESEDYHLVVNRYDRATHLEEEIYRLRSGGFGKYSGDKVVSIFRKDEEYTFRIQWQGSRLTYQSANPAMGILAEGPDFDYTMKAEPAYPEPGGAITDAFTVDTGLPEPGYQLLGVKSNVENFQVVSYTLAANYSKTYIDLAVDTNMDGRIDSLPDGVPAGNGWAESKTFDRDLDHTTPPRQVIIDVNNNNTDAGVTAAGSTNLDVDNQNTRIDTLADKNEMTNLTRGHCFGKLRVYACPIAKIKSGDLELRLSFPTPEDADIVRVFDWRDILTNQDTPAILLGPGKSTCTIDPAKFTSGLEGAGTQSSYRDLVMEGVTYGMATIRLELVDINNNVLATDDIKVTVNVDQFAKTGAALAASRYANSLYGTFPHYAGIRALGVGSTVGYVRASKGRITCRVPCYQQAGDPNADVHTHLTAKHRWALRQNENETNSGQSIWVGLREGLSGGDMTWAQCGLRWEQKYEDSKWPTHPLGFIETGTRLGTTVVTSKHNAADDGGSKITNIQVRNALPLQNWQTGALVVDFVLWKEIVTQISPEGPDANLVSWRAIFRDVRTGKDGSSAQNYFVLTAAAATPQTSDQTVMETFQNAYKAQKLNILDANLETNISVSFAIGTADQKGGASNLATASAMAEGVLPSSQPAESNPVALWDWLQTSFAWDGISVPANNVTQSIRTGRNTNGIAEVGSKPHPFWHTAPTANGFEIWDDRTFGFGQQDSN